MGERSSQAIQTGSSQAECIDAQAASTSPLAFSTNSWGASTASPHAVNSQAIQAGRSQAIINGTSSQEDSAIPPQTGSSWVEGADAQAASTSPQAVSTNSQGVSTTSPRSAQPSSQVNSAKGFQITTHWKILISNGYQFI